MFRTFLHGGAALALLAAIGCGDDAQDEGMAGNTDDAGDAAAAGAGGTTGVTGGAAGESGTDGMAGHAPSCPPQGPFGTGTGDVAANVTLYDCDGNPVELHDLCDLDAAFLYTFAGWCPTCKAFAASGKPNDIHARYENESFEMWFVVTSPATSGMPTQETCANYRDQYGLQMNVLYDPEGATQSALEMRVNSGELVLSRGALIEVNTTGVASTEAKLQQIFGY